MGRKRGTSFPPYPRKAHRSGQARIKQAGHEIYLGVHGSPESWAEYRRRLAAWEDGRRGVPAISAGPARALTIDGLVAAFWQNASAKRYRTADGGTKSELGNFPFSLAPLLAMYGGTPANEFRGPQLLAVQEAMISGSWRTEEERQAMRGHRYGQGWARSVCNRALSRIKLVFRLAEAQGLVQEGTYEHLKTVPGLELDQAGVRETDDRAPVPADVVEKTLPHCNHVVRAIVELLLLTAARPKEIRLLTPASIAQDGRIEVAKGYWITLGAGCWGCRLKRHKTAHKKQRRVILFGPQAQAVLRPFLDRPADQYLFSPAEAMTKRDENRRASRKTPVQPSQVCRKKPNAKRRPGNHYDRRGLLSAVRYAADAADRAGRRKLEQAGLPLPEGRIVPAWTPYQLRHLAAVRLIEQFGWDVARVVLGHSQEEMTRRYGLEDMRAAAKAMGEAG